MHIMIQFTNNFFSNALIIMKVTYYKVLRNSAFKRLIAPKIKVFVYIIYVCVHLYLCIYKYTYMHVYV